MEKVILVRYGEISLKGLNKSFFMDKLIRNIKSALSDISDYKIEKIQGRFLIHSFKNSNIIVERLKKVFGIVSVSPAFCVESDFDKVKDVSLNIMETAILEGVKTFKVESRRGDKSFYLKSPEISRELGAHILDNTENLKVDVHNPETILYVEIRKRAYVYNEIIKCLGGLPVGCNGKAALLISGGIDSPVAGYMIAKRGVELIAVHFHSFPFTSERAKEKVIDLTRIVSKYSGPIKLFIVPFTEIQTEIAEKCNKRQITLIMRRFMMRISEKIAVREKAQALITGESIGQVASQTMESLNVTNSSVDIPVLRPLIGMDKQEIISISEDIGTFETSILPYEDCCTVFVPKHPETRPKKDKIIESEENLDTINLINKAVENTEIIKLPEI